MFKRLLFSLCFLTCLVAVTETAEAQIFRCGRRSACCCPAPRISCPPPACSCYSQTSCTVDSATPQTSYTVDSATPEPWPLPSPNIGSWYCCRCDGEFGIRYCSNVKALSNVDASVKCWSKCSINQGPSVSAGKCGGSDNCGSSPLISNRSISQPCQATLALPVTQAPTKSNYCCYFFNGTKATIRAIDRNRAFAECDRIAIKRNTTRTNVGGGICP